MAICSTLAVIVYPSIILRNPDLLPFYVASLIGNAVIISGCH